MVAAAHRRIASRLVRALTLQDLGTSLGSYASLPSDRSNRPVFIDDRSTERALITQVPDGSWAIPSEEHQ
jgi:hypothetical protein